MPRWRHFGTATQMRVEQILIILFLINTWGTFFWWCSWKMHIVIVSTLWQPLTILIKPASVCRWGWPQRWSLPASASQCWVLETQAHTTSDFFQSCLELPFPVNLCIASSLLTAWCGQVPNAHTLPSHGITDDFTHCVCLILICRNTDAIS